VFLLLQKGDSQNLRLIGSLQTEAWVPGLKDALTRHTFKSSSRGTSNARPWTIGSRWRCKAGTASRSAPHDQGSGLSWQTIPQVDRECRSCAHSSTSALRTSGQLGRAPGRRL